MKHVSVAADPRGLRGLEALVTVAENAVAIVRLQGTRVYVDVTRVQFDFDEGSGAASGAAAAEPPPAAPAPAAVALAPAPRAAAAVPMPTPSAAAAAPAAVATSAAPVLPAPVPRTGGADPAVYRQAMAPIVARFEEIQPFLRSAVSTPTPEVLAALDGTFAELELTLRASDVPRAHQAAHGLLTSAVQIARGAVARSFSGDRMTQVREAMAQFQAAKAHLR